MHELADLSNQADLSSQALVESDGAVGIEPVFGDQPLLDAELLSIYQDESCDTATAICAPSGLLGYVSPACRIFGWSPTELVGRRLADLVHPEDLQILDDSRLTALRTSALGSTTFRVRRRDTGYVWMEASFRASSSSRSDGTVLLIVTLRLAHAAPSADQPRPEAPRPEAQVDLSMEQRIRVAVAQDRFLVHYQPVIEIATGNVVRVEALARILEDDGLVLPGSFLEVAQETGLLAVMDEFVMRRALDQAETWAQEDETRTVGRVSVNVTGRQLADPRFVESVTTSLEANGLQPDALAVEVVEQVLSEASVEAVESLRKLHAMGVAVGVDHFGMTSPAHLRNYPLDYLKIDQALIHRLDTDQGSAAVRAVIELGHGLDLIVAANGVETEAQLETLTHLGCDQVQGFLLGGPQGAKSASLFTTRMTSAHLG